MNMRHIRTVAVMLLLTAAVISLYHISNANFITTAAILSEAPATIIIDPGHGGEDGGAISVTGIPESHFNLEIADKLSALLRLCGFHTFQIRTENVSVYTGKCETVAEKKVSDLKNRVSMVNAIHPAILISIHQNHFSDSKYHGAQVFFSDTKGSRELAAYTQSALRTILDPHNRREIKEASSVYLMKHITCPGILVECGFLSNPKEEQQLQDAAYQKKLVCTIGYGLAQFIQEGNLYGKI